MVVLASLFRLLFSRLLSREALSWQRLGRRSRYLMDGFNAATGTGNSCWRHSCDSLTLRVSYLPRLATRAVFESVLYRCIHRFLTCWPLRALSLYTCSSGIGYMVSFGVCVASSDCIGVGNTADLDPLESRYSCEIDDHRFRSFHLAEGLESDVVAYGMSVPYKLLAYGAASASLGRKETLGSFLAASPGHWVIQEALDGLSRLATLMMEEPIRINMALDRVVNGRVRLNSFGTTFALLSEGDSLRSLMESIEWTKSKLSRGRQRAT